MAVKIKLLRMGKIRAPHYRIVVADARTKRDGRAIETIGRYVPTQEPSLIEVDSQRAQYWLSVGAQPTEPVAAILKVTGDWQRFRGEPGAEGTLRTAAAKPDKKAAFDSIARQAAESGEDTQGGNSSRARREAQPAASPPPAEREQAAAAAGAPSGQVSAAATGGGERTSDVPAEA